MRNGTLGKKHWCDTDETLYCEAHFTVLEQSTHVALYLEEHKSIVRASNKGKTGFWITRHHVQR
jgi:hypothetical protein